MCSIFETTANFTIQKAHARAVSQNQENQQEQNIINEMTTTVEQNPYEEVAHEQKIMCFESAAQQQLGYCTDILNKGKTLQYALQTDLLACDAKWTLFVSAAFSYRYDIVLQPFPPQFANEHSGYDIDALISVIKDTPKLSVVLQNLMEENIQQPSGEVIDLLHWVLIVKGEPVLQLIEGEELSSVLAAINEKSPKLKPTHVFSVESLAGFHSEAIFRAKTLNLPVKLAFMGNKLDQYFSILQNGFPRSPETRNDLKLTTDLQTSLKYSPFCAAWGASQCGSIISCTAIYEFAINVEEDKIMANSNNKTCVDIQLSSPHYIRLRYLIFYGRRFPRTLLAKRCFFSWMRTSKFSFSVLSYMLLLVTIGLVNSNSGEIVKQYMSNKMEHALDFCRKIIN